MALGDAHLHVRHSTHHRPEKSVAADDAGPAWEASTLGDVRVVRIRTLDGSDGADLILRSASAEHDVDFSYGSIVVDLRGNGGGDEPCGARNIRPGAGDAAASGQGHHPHGHARTGPATRAPGHQPWTGRVVAVIDGGTASSAESAALMLRSAFNAVLVGSPSYGAIDYGNSAPCYLPASGIEIHLPSQGNNWGQPVDFTGIQPDIGIPASAAVS